jgi:cytosine permease
MGSDKRDTGFANANDNRSPGNPQEAIGKVKKKDDDYTLVNVPKEGRKAFINVFVVLLGFTFLSTTMAAGAEIGVNFIFTDLMQILIVGSLILSLYAGAMGIVAARTGLTSVLLARLALGKVGAKWADILLGGTQIIWYAVQTAYLGMIFTAALGLEQYFIPITIFWGLFTGAFAIKGTRGMEIVAYVSLIPFIYLAIKLPQLSVDSAGGFDGLLSILPKESNLSFIAAVTIVIGTFISGATNSPNWSRFGTSPIKGFLAGFLAFFIGTFVMVIAGMLGGLSIQSGDMIEVMVSLGIVFMAMVILVLNIWTTNTATAYAVGVAASELFQKPNKVPYVIAGVIIGTVIAILGVYDIFLPFLGYLGVFIPPLGGIIVADHIYTWRKKLPHINSIKFLNFRKANWIAYLAATAIAYISSNTGFGIPTLNGIISAIVLLFIINKIFTAAGVKDNHDVSDDAEYIYNNSEGK